MFRVWGLNMLMLVRGIVGRSDVNDVSKWGFPQAAIVAVSTGGPACASRLLPRLALARSEYHRDLCRDKQCES